MKQEFETSYDPSGWESAIKVMESGFVRRQLSINQYLAKGGADKQLAAKLQTELNADKIALKQLTQVHEGLAAEWRFRKMAAVNASIREKVHQSVVQKFITLLELEAKFSQFLIDEMRTNDALKEKEKEKSQQFQEDLRKAFKPKSADHENGNAA